MEKNSFFIAISNLSGCTTIHYLPPGTGEVAYVKFQDLRDGFGHGNFYKIGQLDSEGCLLDFGRIAIESVDSKGRVVVPANRRLAIEALNAGFNYSFSVTAAAGCEKDQLYQLSFTAGLAKCGISLRKMHADGASQTVELESLAEQYPGSCKPD